MRIFLRDTYDHVAQIMEAVDSTREMGISLVNLHLSNVSQRTNEVMKTLTLMASIFIPLSFLAGVYGMNFDYIPGVHEPESFAIFVGVIARDRRARWCGGSGGAAGSARAGADAGRRTRPRRQLDSSSIRASGTSARARTSSGTVTSGVRSRRHR